MPLNAFSSKSRPLQHGDGPRSQKSIKWGSQKNCFFDPERRKWRKIVLLLGYFAGVIDYVAKRSKIKWLFHPSHQPTSKAIVGLTSLRSAASAVRPLQYIPPSLCTHIKHTGTQATGSKSSMQAGRERQAGNTKAHRNRNQGEPSIRASIKASTKTKQQGKEGG